MTGMSFRSGSKMKKELPLGTQVEALTPNRPRPVGRKVKGEEIRG